MSIRLPHKNICVALLFLATVTTFSFIITSIDVFEDNQIGLIPIWILLYTIVLYVTISRVVVKTKEFVIAELSWVVRLVCAAVGTMGINLNGGDEYGFIQMASAALRHSNDVPTGFRAEVWKIFLVEYHIFGESQFLVRITNGFIGMLGLCVFIHCLNILRVYRDKVRTILILVTALAPWTIILSIGMLRESFYYLFTMLSLLLFIRWTEDRKLKHMVLCLLMTLPSVWLHSGHIVITGAYVLMFLFTKPKKRYSRETLYKFGIICVGVIALYLMIGRVYSGEFSTKIPINGDLSYFLASTMNSNRANYEYASSAYLGFTLDVTTMKQFIIYTPLRMIYLLYSPMIWDCHRVKDLIGFAADSIIFLGGTLAIAKNIKSVKKRDKQGYLILICGVLIVLLVSFAFGWGTMAVGTAMRHRNMLIPIICLMTGICYRYVD